MSGVFKMKRISVVAIITSQLPHNQIWQETINVTVSALKIEYIYPLKCGIAV